MVDIFQEALCASLSERIAEDLAELERLVAECEARRGEAGEEKNGS